MYLAQMSTRGQTFTVVQRWSISRSVDLDQEDQNHITFIGNERRTVFFFPMSFWRAFEDISWGHLPVYNSKEGTLFSYFNSTYVSQPFPICSTMTDHHVEWADAGVSSSCVDSTSLLNHSVIRANSAHDRKCTMIIVLSYIIKVYNIHCTYIIHMFSSR